MKAPVFNAFSMTEVTELELTVTPPSKPGPFSLMLAPMDNFTAVDGVHALVMRCEQSGWYTIVAVFEVKKTIPAERIIHGR